MHVDTDDEAAELSRTRPARGSNSRPARRVALLEACIQVFVPCRSALTAKTRFLSRALACLVAAADGCPRSLSKQTHAWMLYFFTEPLPVSSDLSRPCAHSGRAGAHHGHADGKLRAIVRTPEVGAEERQGRSSNAHVARVFDCTTYAPGCTWFPSQAEPI